MRKCELYKLYVNEKFEGNCPCCVFNDVKNNKCKYPKYEPGMKIGKENKNVPRISNI